MLRCVDQPGGTPHHPSKRIVSWVSGCDAAGSAGAILGKEEPSSLRGGRGAGQGGDGQGCRLVIGDSGRQSSHPSRWAERTLPAASLGDLHPRRASGGWGWGGAGRRVRAPGSPRGPGGALEWPDDWPGDWGRYTWTAAGQGSSPGSGAAKTPWEAAPHG